MTGPELARTISSAFANWNSVFFVFFPDRRRGSLAVEDDGTIIIKLERSIDWRRSKTVLHAIVDRRRAVGLSIFMFESHSPISAPKTFTTPFNVPRYLMAHRTKTALTISTFGVVKFMDMSADSSRLKRHGDAVAFLLRNE